MVLSVSLADLLVAGLTRADAAQLVVVKTENLQATGLQPGAVIDAGKSIELPPGAVITVVSEDGTVSKLIGPFSGKPANSGDAPSDPAMVEALSRLFASNQPTANAWGTFRGNDQGTTFRGGAENGHVAPVWSVDVQHSQTACALPSQAPVLWRAEAAQAFSMTVLQLQTGREGTVTFEPGVTEMSWPQGVPLADGGDYALRDADNRWEQRVLLKLLPNDVHGTAQQAAWMSDAGCVRQARALLASL